MDANNAYLLYIYFHNLCVNTRAYTGGKGSVPPTETQSFHTFQILNSRVKNFKKLVWCSFSALRRLYTWTRATMTEVRMKNLFRMYIHPNRMGAIRDSVVKHLFLNAKPRTLEFGGSKRPFFNFLNIEFNLLYDHCNAVL